MRTLFIVFITVLISISSVKLSISQNLYWVNGDGEWNDPAHWSLSSGGESAQIIPNKNTNVIFDDNSFYTQNHTITIKNNAVCHDFLWELDNKSAILKSSSFLFKSNTSATIEINGSVAVNENIQNHFYGDIILKSSSKATVNVDGEIVGDIIIDSDGGEYFLNKNLETQANLIVKSGGFVTNNHAVVVNGLVSETNSNKTIDLGQSQIRVYTLDLLENKNLEVKSANSELTFLGKNIDKNLKTGGFDFNKITGSSKSVFTYTVAGEDVECNGGFDGKVTATITSGGTADFSYVLKDAADNVVQSSGWVPDLSWEFSNLTAETYLVRITDSDGDWKAQSVTINEPSPLKAEDIVINKGLTCSYSTDAELEAFASDGTPPYSYQWVRYNDATTQWDTLTTDDNANKILSGIGQGVYKSLIKDSNGCGTLQPDGGTYEESIIYFLQGYGYDAFIPDSIEIVGVSSTSTCSGSDNGTITISATGGTGSMTYAIVRASDSDSTIEASGNFVGLQADTYRVYAIDGNDCFKRVSDVVISSLANPTASIIPASPASACPGVALPVDGNPSHGDGTSFVSHVWTGADAGLLDNQNIQDPNFTSFAVGIYNVTYTVTDNNGCTASDVLTINVNDAIDPVAVCQDITVQLDATGNVSITGDQVDNGSSDNCTPAANLNFSVVPNTFNCGDIGANPVVLTVTDLAGNSANCNATVTVQDNTDPVITCPANVTVDNDPGICTATVNGLAPTTSDNCSVVLQTWTMTGATTGNSAAVGINDISGTNFSSGITTVTYRIEDASGNFAECSFTVTVNDTEDPVITCPADVNVNTSDDGAGDCSTTAVIGNPVTSDNCAIDNVIAQIGGSTIDPTTYVFPIGTTTVTWIAEDAAGNTANCAQDVTVTDDENPTVACQDITIQLDATGNATITANDIDAGSSDNCGIASIVASQTSFNCGDLGANPVTLTVTDNDGNSANCVATVTVEDNIDPVITCPADVVVDNDPGICTTVVNGLTPTTSDNCSVVLQTWTMTGATTGNSPAAGINDISGTTFSSGVTTVTYRIEDASGNFAECSFTVTVNDTEDPVITCPADVNVNTSDDGVGDCTTTAVLGNPVVSDNCAIDNVIAQIGGSTIDPTTYVFPIGTTTVTWIAEDAAGNTANCTQDVIVTDDENPVITCPADVTANSSDDGTGDCATTVTLGNPTTSDNCAVNTVIAQVGGSTIDPATYQFPVGLTIVTWIVDDNEGNIASCTQDVTIIDDEDPSITCPADVSIEEDGSCSAVVNGIAPTTDDNCNVVLQTWTMTGATVRSSAAVGINDASGEAFNIGVTTVTYHIEDAAGNSIECSFDVAVFDEVYGGLIDADQTVCYNTIPDPFTNEASATVCGGHTYQWQMKTGTGAWGDITGATGETYTETNPLTEITYYNRKAISDLGFGTAYSDTLIINIQPEAIAYAGKDTTLCFDTPYQVPDADTTYTSSVLWEIYSGNGTFNNPTLINPEYTPALSDGGTVVELVLHADGIGACGENTDTVRLNYLSELIVSVGKESPFTIDSSTTHIDVYFEIEDHNYVGDLSLFLVSPLDSVVELKAYCSNVLLSPTADITLEFYNDPLDTSSLAGATVDECFPVSGKYEFQGEWKKKLHGQDPSNGAWRVRVSDYKNISGSDGELTKATISFTDINNDGNLETILYADSSINKTIIEGSAAAPGVTEHALPITGLTTSCFGLCDATAILTATGGLSPYVLFEWSNTIDFSAPFSTEDTIDLCAGKYYVRVTDSHGCTAIDSVVVGEPDEIKIVSSYIKDATCNGQASGEIMLVLSGGSDVSNLSYTADDGATWYASGDTIKNLLPDVYDIIIRDVTGCEIDTVFTINDPAAIEPGFSIKFITCIGDSDGEITSTPVNGTSPYDIEWSTGDIENAVTTSTITGLSAGTYSVTITDVNLCTQSYDTALIDPEELFINGTPRNEYCIDPNTTAVDPNNAKGQIVVSPTGGSGFYNYAWSGPAGFVSVNNDTISLLEADTYSVTVTDTYGCFKDTTMTVTEDPMYDIFDLDISIEDTSICWYQQVYLNGTYTGTIGDSLFIQGLTTGGTAFDTTIFINSLNPFRDSTVINTDSRLQIIRVENEYCMDQVTNYDLTYTANFNLDIVDQIDTDPLDDTIYLKGLNTTSLAAYVEVTGLDFEWSPTEYLETPLEQITNVTPEESLWYKVIVESSDCVDSSKIYLEYIPSITPNDGFSPNGDGINDYWKIKYIEKFKNNVVTVYNRWGVKVFEQKGYDNDDESKRWDGKNKNGKDLGSGTYYYIIQLNEPDFNPLTGPITIVR